MQQGDNEAVGRRKRQRGLRERRACDESLTKYNCQKLQKKMIGVPGNDRLTAWSQF